MKRDSASYGAIQPTYDKNDCSIRAISVAAGCTYAQASAMFSAAGRKLKKGTDVATSRTIHETWLHMEPVNDAPDMTIEMFILWYPRGSYVLHKSGHAFAIVDGVLHDWEDTTRASTKILRAWQVTTKTREKVERTRSLFE